MKKGTLFLLSVLFSTYSFAETSKSVWLEDIPSKCDGKIILQEIPMIMNESEFLFGEVLDVQNIRAAGRSANQLVCYADLITQESKLNKTYQITFSMNSVGNVLVSYK